MKDILISQFIDDELSLEEKKDFVVNVHNENIFFQKCIKFIDKQIKLKSMFTKQHFDNIPEVSFKAGRFNFIKILSTAALILIFSGLLVFNFTRQSENLTAKQIEYRFVIYSENSNDVQLSGSFSNWNPIKMEKIGDTGYWQLYVNLEKGEHRYFFMVDGDIKYDPTSVFVEEDDFGNKNSVLEV